MEKAPKRSFTTEFKQEAVKLVIEQKLSQSEVAKRLGISVKSLNNWTALQKQGALKGSKRYESLTPEQQRIKELERELKIAQMERDILKKATAYFAKEVR